MTKQLNETLPFLTRAYEGSKLTFNRGIEREGLRVDAQGKLVQTPHPAFLGSNLTHPTITTDFSESQLELITPVCKTAAEALTHLRDVHRFVYSGLKDETIWSASMPCLLPTDSEIPLAQYGTSNLGRLKTTYRNGLNNRYGRAMQTICAIHYNFSVEADLWQHLATLEQKTNNRDYRSERYFDLMRNFRRLSWLPVYLFGASPVVSKSFVRDRPHTLQAFDSDSLYRPNGTSLRNGGLGYQSETQSGMINICYNSLSSYIGTLAEAIRTPHEIYQKMGVEAQGIYTQVSGNVLQSEAEFYTTVRAKCVPPKGANFLHTLQEEGVEYVEVRLLDVNPYLPLGIDEPQMHFLDVFLLYCLLTESPEHHGALCDNVGLNVKAVVDNGQITSTMLQDIAAARSLKDWGTEILEGVMVVAKWLDQTNGGGDYASSVNAQFAKLTDTSNVPSVAMLDDMRASEMPFYRFMLDQSLVHKTAFLAQPLSDVERQHFQELARISMLEHAELEATPEPAFDDYLKHVLAAYESL
ncbi:MAG: glutamate--cysteine ligase [Candidatus Pseudothioglobus sp.]|jgi:glutamate--cysteine ligase